jgi:hypothetical protein
MKWPPTLMDEARDEAYAYFDKNIRTLAKDSKGEISTIAHGLENNDIDAFRHAYVSAVFAIEYNEEAADLLGRLNEFGPGDLYSNSKDPRSLNMDLWNNQVGREYARKFNGRDKLLKAIHQAMKNGELITSIEDKREFQGSKIKSVNKSKSVIVLKEDNKGRNELFFDLVSKTVYSREEFVTKIKAGEYKNYFIKLINGVETPHSKPDSHSKNNLD